VETFPRAALPRAAARDLARRDDALVLSGAPVELAQAKNRAAAGDAGLAERFRLLRHHASTRRWEPAGAELIEPPIPVP